MPVRTSLISQHEAASPFEFYFTVVVFVVGFFFLRENIDLIV